MIDIIYYVINYLSVKKLQIVILLAISTLVFVLVAILKPPTYQANMAVIAKNTEYTTVQEVSSPLLDFHTISSIADSIKSPFDKRVMEEIISIEISEVEPHPAERRKGCVFNITVRSNNKETFKSLHKPFIDYFNELPYTKHENSIRSEAMNSFLEKLNEEIERLQNIRNEKSDRYSNITESIVNLEAKKSTIRKKINGLKEFNLLKPFDNVKVSNTALDYAIRGFSVGILINLLLFTFTAIKAMIAWNESQNN